MQLEHLVWRPELITLLIMVPESAMVRVVHLPFEYQAPFDSETAKLDGNIFWIYWRTRAEALAHLGVGIPKRIAEHLKVAVPKAASAWETMLVMTVKVLALTEEEATGILAARVTKRKADACVEELLQMDEASKLLSKEDEEQFDKDKATLTKIKHLHETGQIISYRPEN